MCIYIDSVKGSELQKHSGYFVWKVYWGAAVFISLFSRNGYTPCISTATIQPKKTLLGAGVQEETTNLTRNADLYISERDTNLKKVLALFPGPAQLFVTCSTNSDGKLGGAWERG